MAKRSFVIRKKCLYVNNELVLENLSTTEKRELAFEASRSAGMSHEDWLGVTHRRVGYTDVEQCQFIMNAINVENLYGRESCTRERLTRRVCRKYRGLNAAALDAYLKKLIAQGYVGTEEIPCSGGAVKRYKPVYYAEDTDYVPRESMPEEELPMSSADERKHAEWLEVLAKAKDKYKDYVPDDE